jgi:D-alanyl-D-alanine carboxypeptidase
MRKFLFILPLIFSCAFAHAADYRAALVADMNTGRVLISENANMPNYPASLTKIMTLYLTFDALEHGRLHLDDYLIVSQNAAAAAPVKLGLTAGSKIRVEDAITALAVYSANDVARVLAENLKGGKENTFASLMTRVAREIGLTGTNFENSSGLPDDDHLSTARDIALLSMAVYKHFPQYWKYFGIKTWVYNGKTYTNGNRLLETYPGCDGMKTGFTNKSKYSLVATARRGGHHLISVVLGAETKDVRFDVSTRLLNRGFELLNSNAMPATYVENNTKPQTAPAPVTSPIVQKYATDAPAMGGVGVQFGAFSSPESANAMIAQVKNKLGAHAYIETTDSGLYRVRVRGLSESAAQNLKNRAMAAGIDCYVFH